MEGLASLQDRMQTAMLDPAGIADAVVSAGIRGDETLEAEARLAIYARSYRLRLLECLRTEYPMLEALVGPAVFELFARGYCAAAPSRSYTLYDFGAGFPDYLARARPQGDGDPSAVAAIPAALARIERAKAEVRLARGIEDRTMGGGEGSPFLATLLGIGLQRRYVRPDSVRLLALPFDFAALMSRFERAEVLLLPDFTPSFLAVSRVRFSVECHDIEAWQFEWLESLSDGDAEPAAYRKMEADERWRPWLSYAIGRGLIADRDN